MKGSPTLVTLDSTTLELLWAFQPPSPPTQHRHTKKTRKDDELYLDAPSLPYLLPTKLNIFIYCDSDLRPCEEARHKMLERSQHPAVSIYYAFSIQH